MSGAELWRASHRAGLAVRSEGVAGRRARSGRYGARGCGMQSYLRGQCHPCHGVPDQSGPNGAFLALKRNSPVKLGKDIPAPKGGLPVARRANRVGRGQFPALEMPTLTHPETIISLAFSRKYCGDVRKGYGNSSVGRVSSLKANAPWFVGRECWSYFLVTTGRDYIPF